MGLFPRRLSFSPLLSSHPDALTLCAYWIRSSAQTRGLRGPRGHVRGRQSRRGRRGGLEGLGSRCRLLKPTGKRDRKEGLGRGVRSRPHAQLFSDGNAPAVGARGRDTRAATLPGVEHGPAPRASKGPPAGPPALSALPVNTAGDRGDGARKQPFGQDSQSAAGPRHRFLWAVAPVLLFSVCSPGSPQPTEPTEPARPNCGPWGLDPSGTSH